MQIVKLKDGSFSYQGLPEEDFRILEKLVEKNSTVMLSNYFLIQQAIELALNEGIEKPTVKEIQEIVDELEEMMEEEFTDSEDEADGEAEKK